MTLVEWVQQARETNSHRNDVDWEGMQDVLDALHEDGYRVVKLARVGNVHPANAEILKLPPDRWETYHWELHSTSGLHMTDLSAFVVAEELT